MQPHNKKKENEYASVNAILNKNNIFPFPFIFDFQIQTSLYTEVIGSIHEPKRVVDKDVKSCICGDLALRSFKKVRSITVTLACERLSVLSQQ